MKRHASTSTSAYISAHMAYTARQREATTTDRVSHSIPISHTSVHVPHTSTHTSTHMSTHMATAHVCPQPSS